MKYKSSKKKVVELQTLLNRVVIHNDLNSDRVMNMSKKLDVLIMKYYLDYIKTKKSKYT